MSRSTIATFIIAMALLACAYAETERFATRSLTACVGGYGYGCDDIPDVDGSMVIDESADPTGDGNGVQTSLVAGLMAGAAVCAVTGFAAYMKFGGAAAAAPPAILPLTL